MKGVVSSAERSANPSAFYQQYLESELASRQQRNPRYSLRAFARSLDMNPGALSQILGAKRLPSFKMAQKMLAALGPSPKDRQLFVSSLTQVQRERGLQRLAPEFRAEAATEPAFSALSLDAFHVIADWYHYAILELSLAEGFRADPKWIAAELGITPLQARMALRRLTDLGLLESSTGVPRKSSRNITTADKHLTTSALRRHQRQLLEKAIDALEEAPLERRSQDSMTMAIDPAKLPVARRMIQAFMQQLCEVLESGERKSVYALSVSLFPLHKPAPKQRRLR